VLKTYERLTPEGFGELLDEYATALSDAAHATSRDFPAMSNKAADARKAAIAAYVAALENTGEQA